MPVTNIIHTDDIDQQTLHIILFSALWCSPCKIAAPIYKKMSDIYEDIVFLKCDINANDNLVEYYKIRTLPTYIVEHNGIVINTIKNDIDELYAYIQELTNKSIA